MARGTFPSLQPQPQKDYWGSGVEVTATQGIMKTTPIWKIQGLGGQICLQRILKYMQKLTAEIHEYKRSTDGKRRRQRFQRINWYRTKRDELFKQKQYRPFLARIFGHTPSVVNIYATECSSALIMDKERVANDVQQMQEYWHKDINN